MDNILSTIAYKNNCLEELDYEKIYLGNSRGNQLDCSGKC